MCIINHGGFIFSIATVIIAAIFADILHVVPERHVGVYHRGGRLADAIAAPGFHFKLPFVTEVALVQISMQTDRVDNVICVPKDAATGIEFASVEVVHHLRRDKVLDLIKAYGVDYGRLWVHDTIHHEINRFCSAETSRAIYIDAFAILGDMLQEALQKRCDRHADGVVIVDVRVAKPVVIPDSIRKTFEAAEAERAAASAAEKVEDAAKQRVEEEHFRAIVAAESEAQESAIRSETSLKKAKAEADASAYRERSKADSGYYAAVREAEANRVLLTESYLRLREARVWQNTAKAYFGEKIPNIMGFPTLARDSTDIPVA
ncbi:hypothetical protein CYMTET_2689 [Cymbomonas tetramitiformis]|uniref:Band 7 domain-containing protein n=1 Tax=Cymbomonas tetramitiformis TaxID=36881 RepID=A0AAE0LMA3_9CHLO|nr:hypothetical protein CYMTET_2689 [Cymbomonas tetramitiformis]